MHIKLKNICMEFPVSNGKKIAVNNATLSIGNGERLGIIGRNGAGKTTLLQIISDLLRPTSGMISIKGRVDCVMTLGVGLREELSGRDNIYIDGELNGRSRDQIDALLDDIISFADIGEYIDYPVRTYSTGMKARLAFALITFIEPEILIIDEALSVGDADFAKKAAIKMKQLCENGKIIILVSHSMKSIVEMCDRCIWMDQGSIVMDGDPEAVTTAYLDAVRQADEQDMLMRFKKRVGGTRSAECAISKVEFLDASGLSKRIWRSDDEMTIRIYLSSASVIESPDIKLSFERHDGNILMENWASIDGYVFEPVNGDAAFEVTMGEIAFGEDTYEVLVELHDRSKDTESLLASYTDIIKVEKPLNMKDSPAYFCPVHISAEKTITELS